MDVITRTHAAYLCIDLGNQTKVSVNCSKYAHSFYAFWFLLHLPDGAFSFKGLTSTGDRATFSPSTHVMTWEYFTLGGSVLIQTDHMCFLLNEFVNVRGFEENVVEIKPEAYKTFKKRFLLTPQASKTPMALDPQGPVTLDCPGLKTVLDNKEASDFAIVCKDGERIQVHISILSSYWPFFKKMMGNDCKERSDKTLKLDFSPDIVKLMVAFIYKQQFPLTLNQAVALLQLSDMYMLPDMGELSTNTIRQKIKTEKSLEVLIDGWESCREANNSELQQLFAKRIAACKPRDNGELFKSMDQEKLMELFFDAVELQ